MFSNVTLQMHKRWLVALTIALATLARGCFEIPLIPDKLCQPMRENEVIQLKKIKN